MKKQLIVLSALFVVVSANASMYERMKASAKAKYAAAKEKLSSAGLTFENVKQSADKYLPQAKELISSNMPAIKNAMKEPVAEYLDVALKLAASQARAVGVPESVIDKGKEVAKQGYVSQFGTTPKDEAGDELLTPYVSPYDTAPVSLYE